MRHHPSIGRSTALYTISVMSFFLSLHIALPSYFNSNFLSTLTNNNLIDLIYSAQAILTVIILLLMHNILRRFGNFRTTLALIAIQILAFYGIIFSTSIRLTAPFIVLSLTITYLISFTFDIFLEKNSDVDHIGSIRGHYMTASNSAWILGPLFGGMLILGNNYKGVYVVAFGLLFPLLYIVYKNFSRFVDPQYPKVSLIQTFKSVARNPDISKLLIINTVLQTFYAWMTIYTPIYLYKNMGFDISEIGIIFTIMLIPFILVELPLGKLADRKLGEKEIMFTGYVIMGISTICLAFVGPKNLVIWTIVLFITRIGAAAAEIMIETYFFKKVDKKDSEILGAFRVTRPLSYLIAPILTSVSLFFVTDVYLFVILGVLCLITLIPISFIRDTN